MDTAEKVRQIKRSFRLYMNGVAASSMRQKGLDYKVNWGISQIELRRMAGEYGKSRELADALWLADVRECKLLATLVMPPAEMSVEQAGYWAAGAATVELAESMVFNLFQYMDDACQLAARLLLSDKDMARLCAYNLVCRLLKRKVACDDSLCALLLQKAGADVRSANRQLLHALVNCLGSMSVCGNAYAKKADNILNMLGFDAF